MSFSNVLCCLCRCCTVFRSRPRSEGSPSLFSFIRPNTSMASWWKRCSSYEAASICVRVSISSSRSAQASFKPSFHSATLAFSGWPDSIKSSANALTPSTRSWPMVLVSRANSLNLSLSIFTQKKSDKPLIWYFRSEFPKTWSWEEKTYSNMFIVLS